MNKRQRKKHAQKEPIRMLMRMLRAVPTIMDDPDNRVTVFEMQDATVIYQSKEDK